MHSGVATKMHFISSLDDGCIRRFLRGRDGRTWNLRVHKERHPQARGADSVPVVRVRAYRRLEAVRPNVIEEHWPDTEEPDRAEDREDAVPDGHHGPQVELAPLREEERELKDHEEVQRHGEYRDFGMVPRVYGRRLRVEFELKFAKGRPRLKHGANSPAAHSQQRTHVPNRRVLQEVSSTFTAGRLAAQQRR